MKKVFCFFMLLSVSLGAIFVFPTIANASVNTVNLTYELNEDKASYTVYGEFCYSPSKLVIPAEYKGLPVTHIGDYAFNASKIVEAVLPDSLTTIGISAFESTNLKSIVIPDSVTFIDYNAFAHIYLLEEVVFSDNIKELSHSLFYNCGALKTVVLPKNLEKIGSTVFYGCDNLTKIVLPDTIKIIDSSAFNACESLVDINFNEGLEEIGESAFGGCSSLKQFIAPSSLKKLGDAAFCGCSSLSDVKLNEGLELIDEYAFFGCIKLKEIEIPSTVIEMGCSIFQQCSELEDIRFKNKPVTIPRGMFEFCYALEEISIPETVTEIEFNAFSKCKSLRIVNLPDGIKALGHYIFSECTSLKHIDIPDSVTTIGESAFSSCSSLEEIYIPKNVTNMYGNQFTNCISLKIIDVDKESEFLTAEDNVLYTKDKTRLIKYAEAKADTNFLIPRTVVKLDDYAFINAKNLKEIEVPGTINTIGLSTFYACSSLEKLVIQEGVEKINGSAFSECPMLESVSLPRTLKTIGTNAFFVPESKIKYVFYNSSYEQWMRIDKAGGNFSITSANIHFNATTHNSETINIIKPNSETPGEQQYCCSVCGFVQKSEPLENVNDYFSYIDLGNSSIDEENKIITSDVYACKDTVERITLVTGFKVQVICPSSYGFIGTGSKIQVYDSNDNLAEEYTFVIKGDINGDSVCDAIDCMLLDLARTGNTELSGVSLLAGDFTLNDEVTIHDFQELVKVALS